MKWELEEFFLPIRDEKKEWVLSKNLNRLIPPAPPWPGKGEDQNWRRDTI
jgi:hypothetical protein